MGRIHKGYKMPKKEILPKRLYKYRNFSNLVLDMLIADTIYFTDPDSFNDPLDTKPSLDTDVNNDELEHILIQLYEERINAEMASAANILSYHGPNTQERVNKLTKKKISQLLLSIRYNATNPDYEVNDPVQLLLRGFIQRELLQRYDKGIFSLAERANCPLMWSHYGDQHKGLCLGYSIPEEKFDSIHKITYGGSRSVKASMVANMLNGNVDSQLEVDAAVLLRKATDWRYEKEWRVLGKKGEQDSPLELDEVIFGMRCANPVRYTIVKALEKREHPISFFEIVEQTGRFPLKKNVLDIDELNHSYPRCARSLRETFDDKTE
jgi:hypothetical protein